LRRLVGLSFCIVCPSTSRFLRDGYRLLILGHVGCGLIDSR